MNKKDKERIAELEEENNRLRRAAISREQRSCNHLWRSSYSGNYGDVWKCSLCGATKTHNIYDPDGTIHYD